LHLVGILFPHINDDARSKSHQIWMYGLWTGRGGYAFMLHTTRGTSWQF